MCTSSIIGIVLDQSLMDTGSNWLENGSYDLKRDRSTRSHWNEDLEKTVSSSSPVPTISFRSSSVFSSFPFPILICLAVVVERKSTFYPLFNIFLIIEKHFLHSIFIISVTEGCEHIKLLAYSVALQLCSCYYAFACSLFSYFSIQCYVLHLDKKYDVIVTLMHIDMYVWIDDIIFI